MLDQLLTWAVRSAHVLGAAFWLGGYAVMLLVFVPFLARDRNETVRQLALATSRIISFSGALTIVAGLVLIWRTRGYSFILLGGEWGGIVVSCFVLAFAMMGVGDNGLRPALRRLDPDSPASVGPVRRWAMIGLGLGIAALLMMTRAIYARS
jgi:putative copper export protein